MPCVATGSEPRDRRALSLPALRNGEEQASSCRSPNRLGHIDFRLHSPEELLQFETMGLVLVSERSKVAQLHGGTTRINDDNAITASPQPPERCPVNLE